MGNRNLKFSEICPIVNISGNLLINGDGSVTIGIKVIKQPEVYNCTIDEYNNIHDRFISAINLLPPNTVFHKQDFFYIDSYNSHYKENDGLIFKENLILYDNRPILKSYSHIFLTFCVSHPLVRSSWSFNTPLSWLDTKKSFRFLSFVEENIENYSSAFISNINSIKGFKVARMNTDELFCAFYEYFSLSYKKRETDIEKIKKSVLPDFIFEDASLNVGGEYVSVVTMSAEGDKLYAAIEPKLSNANHISGVQMNSETEIPQSFVFPLGLGFACNHILNTVIEVMDNEKVVNYLKSEKFKLNFGKALKNDNAIAKQLNIDLFTKAITEENLRSCLTNVNIILHHPDQAILSQLCEMALSSISRMKESKGWREVKGNYFAFMNSSPGNAKTLGDFIVSTTHQSACYIHIEGQYFSDREGLLYVDRYGCPVVVNRWNSPHIVNRNAVLIGPSGSGKSFYINGEITQILNQGNHVFMIDIGHSYLRNSRYENAKYFDSAKISEFRLNMFLCDKDENGNYQIWGEDEESKFDVINKVFAILTVIWKGSKEYADGEDILLKDIIKYFYRYINNNKIFPDVDSFYEYIDYYEKEIIKEKDKKFIDFDSLRLSLRDYLKDSMYGDLLNSRESINITSDKFIVFDMESVSKTDKKLFSIISVIIIDIILSKIKKLKGVRKTLIIDEALDFLLDARMSEFIAYLYRTVRKKDGQVIIATQDAGFFKGLPEIIRNSILRQSDTKILLNHNNSRDAFMDLVSLGILAPKHLPLLKSLKSTANGREFMIIQGDKPMVLLNEVSWYAGLVYTSVQWDVVKIDELIAQYENIDAAIREYHNQIQDSG